MLKFDGYDTCLIGVATVWHPDGTLAQRLVYDGDKIVELLMEGDDLSEDDAREHVSFNMEGAYVGPSTPIIVWPESMESVDMRADDGEIE
jgi:hypothetical protein